MGSLTFPREFDRRDLRVERAEQGGEAGALSVALISTQAWPQTARLAMRFAAYGCKVTAVCPPISQLHHLRRLNRVAACYPLRAGRTLHYLARAIVDAGADQVVPTDDLAVWLLHALADQSPAIAPLIERSIGASGGFTQIRSRHRLLGLARGLGIAVPETARIHTLAELEAWAADAPVPFVLKKDGTFGGGGVSMVQERSDLARKYAELTSRPGRRARWKQRVVRRDPTAFLSLPTLGEPEISVQAYVDGTAANAMFVAQRGQVLGSVQARVVASKGKTGPALMIQLVEDDRIEAAGRLLAQSLELSGFFGLDFILEAGTGTPYLIEMNPRCTQLGHIALAGQPDLAGILWSQWTGREPPRTGDAALGNAIAFYPQALEWAPESAFLRHARYDVGEEERALIDALPVGNQSLGARVYRAGRASLRSWTQVAHSLPDEAFYFEGAGAGSATTPSPALSQLSAAAAGIPLSRRSEPLRSGPAPEHRGSPAR